MLTEEQKRTLFVNGRCAFPPPPVCTEFWNIADWVKFVDEYGSWVVDDSPQSLTH